MVFVIDVILICIDRWVIIISFLVLEGTFSSFECSGITQGNPQLEITDRM